MAPYVRPFYAISQTTLRDAAGYRYPFHGGFTTVNLPAGALLGFYNGSFKPVGAKGYARRNRNAFGTSDFIIVPKYRGAQEEGSSDDDETLDERHARKEASVPVPKGAAAYPLALINEPPAGQVANVMAAEVSRAKDHIMSLPGRTPIAALAYYATRDIRAGEELFVHYGPGYRRTHYDNPLGKAPEDLVGKASTIPKAQRETVRDLARRFGPQFEIVPKDCYVVYDTPEIGSS